MCITTEMLYLPKYKFDLQFIASLIIEFLTGPSLIYKRKAIHDCHFVYFGMLHKIHQRIAASENHQCY